MRCAERQIRAGPARPSDLLKRTSRTFSFLQARLGLAVWIRTKYVLLLTAVTRVTTCHTLKCQVMRLIPLRLSFMCDHSIGVSTQKKKSGRELRVYLVLVLFSALASVVLTTCTIHPERVKTALTACHWLCPSIDVVVGVTKAGWIRKVLFLTWLVSIETVMTKRLEASSLKLIYQIIT